MEIAPRDVQVYYELSWAILSTIGLVNLCIGAMVVGIAGWSPISLVPVVVSAAGALANGMCYYAFYADYPIINTAVASVFADIAWLIQEAGLSFYSYVILRRVLRNRSRLIFMILFWSLIVVIAALRFTILACRVRFILGHSTAASLQLTIDHLHVGYFATIAVVELLSAVFLLRKFNTARKISLKAAMKKNGLFSYLMRSTEIRLALLAIIGTTRAITYSFQDTAQSATSVASEFDRFAYTLECMFPMIMYIDILASRLIFRNDVYSHSSRSGGAGAATSRSHGAGPRQFTQTGVEGTDMHMYPLPKVERHIEVQGGFEQDDAEAGRNHNGSSRQNHHRSANRGGSQVRTSSQEYIIDDDGTRSRATTGSDFGEELSDGSKKHGHSGISKTVEFKVVEAREV